MYGAFNTPSLKFEPSIDISFGFGAVGNDTFHDAAFDAYCTGLAFARMAAFAEKHAGKMDVDGAKPDGEAATAEPASAADAPLAAPLDLNGPILKPLANFIHMMRSLTTSVNIGGDDILADLSHIFHLQHVTQPLPTPPPAFDEVRKIIAQEFPDLEGLAASSFIKQAPFEDYAWILTINDRAAAAQFADRFLPKMVEGEEAPTEPPLVGGNWKVTTMREYKDSKFSNRKRANPDEPSMENGNSSQKRKVDE